MVETCLGALVALGILKCNIFLYADNEARAAVLEPLRLDGTQRPQGIAAEDSTPTAHIKRLEQQLVSMSPLRYFVVDAFTDRPFAGNPAAVVPLSAWRDDAWLQDVAMEMNLSETAFLVKEDGDYRLRWFTPKVEVALCGHATLAAAHVLWSEGYVPARRGDSIPHEERAAQGDTQGSHGLDLTSHPTADRMPAATGAT